MTTTTSNETDMTPTDLAFELPEVDDNDWCAEHDDWTWNCCNDDDVAVLTVARLPRWSDEHGRLTVAGAQAMFDAVDEAAAKRLR